MILRKIIKWLLSKIKNDIDTTPYEEYEKLILKIKNYERN